MSDATSRRGAAERSQETPTLPPMMGRGGPPGMRMQGEKVRAKDARRTTRRLWGYLRRSSGALLAAGLLAALNTGLNLLGPYLLAVAIDDYLLPGDLAGLARVCLFMLVVYGASSLFTWLQSYIMVGVAQHTVRDLRNNLFTRLQRLPLRVFDQTPHGDLMSRLTNDLENVNSVLSENLIQLVSSTLGLVGSALAMLWINPQLALISLTIQPLIMVGLTQWLGKRIRAGFRQQQATLGALNGFIEETVTGQQVVKAYSRESVAMTEFDAANGAYRQAAVQAQTFAGFMGPIMNFVGNLGLAIVAGAGGWMVIQGQATVGEIAAFITYSRQFSRPLNEIANLYNALQSALAGLERVFAVMDEAPELADAPDALPLSPLAGAVAFNRVTFAYEQGSPVLRDVSLDAQPGQVVALVGPTGAGKTTIVNLLTRFYEIDAGRIAIDGKDIRQVRRDELRRQLGIVLQDTFLFSATVMENIRYGRLDASDDEVITAAKLANADQFIHRLPLGYATPLSERGGNLSQGQRQMIAIARAILADPGILILDEATSSVDTRTEQHIQEAMRRLMVGRTSFVIAHRLSTIRDADQILVIDHGEIIERGNHQELLTAEGFYHHLYHSQFRANGRA